MALIAAVTRVLPVRLAGENLDLMRGERSNCWRKNWSRAE
jgi:hypothetical protein